MSRGAIRPSAAAPGIDLRAACLATLEIPPGKAATNWNRLRDSLTANFRVINPKDFCVLP